MLSGTGDPILAENGFDLELVHELDFPNVFFCESKLVVFAYHLEPGKN